MSKVKRVVKEWVIDAFAGKITVRRGDADKFNYTCFVSEDNDVFLIYDEDLADFIDVLLEIQNG